MLASTIQFTTNPPTPTPHHPQTRQQNTGQATRAHCPRTPTACHPHTHQARGGTHHQQTTTTTRPQQPTTAGVFPIPSTRRPTSPARQCTTVQSPGLPREQAPPAGPDPSTARTTNDQEATPTQIPILRKEVIQPHLPVRLPCYDFVPITSPTFDRSP